MKNKINYRVIVVFYLIALGCRFLTTQTSLLKDIFHPYFEVLLDGIGPALGALVVFKVFDLKHALGLKGNYKNLLIPFLIYWVLPIVLIGAVSYYLKGDFPWISVLIILIYGLLEEIGWRGFLYQHLKPLPLFYNILIVGTLWFLWHLNFDLTLSNFLFYAILILGSWGIGKVADVTHSLLAVSAFHSLYNFFPSIDTTKLLLIITLIVIWIGGLILRKRMYLQRQKSPSKQIR